MDTHVPRGGPISVSAGAGRRRVPPGGAFEPGHAGRMRRYGKRPDLIVDTEEPFNAATGPAALAEGSLTATDAFYVRGHGAVPKVDPAAWRLHVDGLVERELELSLATLREAFRERAVSATLQCAGNRRAGLIAIRDIPGEAPWAPARPAAVRRRRRRRQHGHHPPTVFGHVRAHHRPPADKTRQGRVTPPLREPGANCDQAGRDQPAAPATQTSVTTKRRLQYV
jgi:hypothetical protein